MNWFSATCHKCIAKLWLIGLVLLVTTAISFSLLRGSLPYLNEYRGDLSIWLYQKYDIDLSFSRIDGHWQGVGPLITVDQLRLNRSSTLPVDLTIEQIRVQVDVRGSLLALAPRFRLVAIDSPQLHIELDATEKQSTGALPWESIRQLLYSQFQHISIQQGQLTLANQHHQSPTIPIDAFTWLNSPSRRQLTAQFGRITSDTPPLNDASPLNKDDSLLNRDQRQGAPDIAPLAVIVDLYGQAEEAPRGRLYARSNELQLLDWVRPLLPLDSRLRQAALNFELWGEFSQAQLDSAMLKFDPSQLNWTGQKAGDEHQLAIEQGVLQWLPVSEGWQLQTVGLQMATDDKPWEDFAIAIKQTGERLSGSLSAIAIERLVPLMGLVPEVTNGQLGLMEQLSLSGRLEDFQWQRHSSTSSTPGWHYQGAMTELGWQRVGAIPKVTELAIDLQGDESSGQVQLRLNDQLVDFGEHFRYPIDVETLSGELSWQLGEQFWQLQSHELKLLTPELTSAVNFKLSGTDQQSPVLALYGELALTDAAQAGDYFPVTAMGQPLADYLNGALQAGHIEDAQILWQGALANFPYANHQGIFQVLATVEDTEFLFDPHWQPLTESRLHLHFEDASMLITGLDGKLEQLTFNRLTAAIPYLGKGAELFVDFALDASPADITQVMLASPLAGSVGSALQDLEVGGTVAGDVSLYIPLTGGEARATGTVDFADNSLMIHPLDLALSGLNGQLSFDDGQLTANELHLQWYGQPVELDLTSQDANGFYGVEIDLLAGWHSDKIPQEWKTHLDAYARGTLDWQGKLLLKITEEEVDYQANFRSPMKGLALKLPKPLNKYIAQEEELTVSVTGDSSRGQVNAGFGTRAEMLTQYDLIDKGEGPKQLEISAVDLLVGRRFVAKDPVSAHDTTLRVELDELALDQWQQFIGNLEDLDQKDTAVPPLKRIEAVVKRLKLYGQELNDARVQARREDDAWVVELRSSQVAGQVTLYHDLKDGGLEADFTRFELSMGDSGSLVGLSQAELQQLPPLKFHCDVCVVGGMDLGSVDFTTTAAADGLEITSLTITSGKSELQASGHWGFNDDGEYSQFKGNFKADDFDKTLMGLGYVSNIRDSDAKVSFDLGWQGSIYQPMMETVAGEVKWRLGEGHLAEISDKGARIFSLFSLDSLRRKLVLDFRDVFQKGLFYNKFKGSFQVKNGVAITDDTYMDGVAGGLNVTGSYNLTNNALDYLLVFSPKLISNLPVVAGVVTSTPTVFLLTFAITKVLEPMIEVVSQVRFRLTGTVDEPQFVELERKRRSFKVPEEMLPKPKAVNTEIVSPQAQKVVRSAQPVSVISSPKPPQQLQPPAKSPQ